MATGTRFRSRMTPNPVKVGMRKVGDIYLYDGNKWVPHPWGSSVSAYNTEKFIKMEACRDEIHKGPPWTSGGPFTKIKITLPQFEVKGVGSYDSQGSLWPTGVGNYPVKYVGGFTEPQFVGDPIPGSVYANPDLLLAGNYLLPSLASWGSQAFNKTKPVLEHASAAVAIAESRDIPRMLRSTSESFSRRWEDIRRHYRGGRRDGWRMDPKPASDEFLNVQFGWIPFLSDLSKFKDTFDHSYRYIDRISGGNDRWVRRRRTLLAGEPVYTRIDGGIGQRCEPLGGMFSVPTLFASQPTWECGMTTSTHVTTSGMFRYYRPEFDKSKADYYSAWNAVQRQMTLYGARVSPSNIYRATPWSWIGDWFTNAGGIVDAASSYAVDGMVAKYLYLMHHQMRTITLTQVLPFKSGTVILQWHRLCDVKRREEAGSPYGFSLSGTALTLRQMAILAALGISGKFPAISP